MQPEALLDFRSLRGCDEDHQHVQEGATCVAEVSTFDIFTPRFKGTADKSLKVFNVATPRLKPELALTSSNMFSPPWSPSPHWAFKEAPTTLELHNLPCNMSEDGLVEFLDQVGLCGMYNFIHVVRVIQDQHNEACAIINADDHLDGCRIAGRLHLMCNWLHFGQCNPCNVRWCFSCQGLEQLAQHYANAWYIGTDGNYKGPWVRTGGYWVALPLLVSAKDVSSR